MSIIKHSTQNLSTLKKLNKILATLLALNCILGICFLWLNRSINPTISFLDVGQGDCILINTKNQQQILIDGGPDNTVLSKLSNILSPYDRHIELMILTHPHEDHITGLFFVFENYHIDKLLIPKISKPNSLMENLISLAKNQKTEIFYGYFPQKILFDKYSLNILYPFDQNPPLVNDLNDNSLVLLLDKTSEDKKILLTGDISKNIEISLTKKYQQNIDVDILKIAHHGSESATSNSFVETTSPETVIISCGQNNRFNHPSQKTINLLNKKNIHILQTSINKDIIFPL